MNGYQRLVEAIQCPGCLGRAERLMRRGNSVFIQDPCSECEGSGLRPNLNLRLPLGHILDVTQDKQQ